MKKKRIAIDADFIVFQCTEGKEHTQGTFDNEKVKLKPFKEKFRAIVRDIEEEVAVEFLGVYKIKGKAKILLSDPAGNFRYDIFPNYKANRKGSTRSELFYRLRKWALKEYGYTPNIEADDEAGYLAGTGKYIVCSMDKDVLKSTAGDHFDVYHSRRGRVTTSELEARNFTLLQTVMGDPTDGIIGIPRVGERTAIKLLDEHGWNWKGVLLSYKAKGLTDADALLNRRLVDLHQWSPNKGVKLWVRK